jgi:DNA-binding NarL/FixJ family response regulator
MKNAAGEYHKYLGQDYFFYGATPHPAVYAIQIGTVIDWCNTKVFNSHRYIGKDTSLFRFPDEELLKTRPNYSARELEIIKLTGLGLSSEQIADKLFISIHTVSTHRSNILERSGKATLMDLIYELKDQGLI